MITTDQKWPSPLTLKLFAAHKINKLQQAEPFPDNDYKYKSYFYRNFYKVFEEIVNETAKSHQKNGSAASPYLKDKS